MTETKFNKQDRRFTEPDRRALFIAANGLCQYCGKPLPPNFHADHEVPYWIGGTTTLDNAKAACPECNLKKGGKLNIWTPEGVTPRRWQVEAIDSCIRTFIQGNLSFLSQATPGAGKTLFACMVARYLLDIGKIARILVVSPSVNLREDWADGMSLFEIDIDPNSTWKKERTAEYKGKSTTYHTLMMVDGRHGGAQIEHILQSQSKTLVILDEIHHAGDSLSWGNGLRYACQNASAILCLSGTPFRSDGNPIPFIKYDEQGRAVADYVYGYGEALNDKPQVCRAVYFPSYEGNLSWLQNNQLYKASFSDDLDDDLQSARLRAALWSGEWVESTIREAQNRLSIIRCVHPDAAGLVVAMDKKHAEHLAKALKRITLSEPLVVTSDDDDAKEKIKDFRGKTDPWIIAIKMISEGVDIKRLRVCIYLSNVVTDLFFRQVVGRIVRFIPGIKDQEAFFYIPADHRLVEMAQRFREERIQGLLNELDQMPQSIPEDEQQEFWEDLIREDGFRVLSGESWHNSTITYEGDTFSAQELNAAEQFAKQYGYNVLPEVMAKMLRDFPALRGNSMNGVKVDPDVVRKPLYQRHSEMRDAFKEQERKCLAELRERWFSHLSESDGYRRLNGGLKRRLGISGKENATIEQLKERHQLIIDAVVAREMPAWAK